MRLLDQLRERLQHMHYSLRTEKNYVYWARWFIRWQGLKHPKDMGGKEVEAFLSMLANERKAAPSTHRQALSALLFLYKEVLDIELPWMQQDIGHPVPTKRISVVLTPAEVRQILDVMEGVTGLPLRDGTCGFFGQFSSRYLFSGSYFDSMSRPCLDGQDQTLTLKDTRPKNEKPAGMRRQSRSKARPPPGARRR